MIGVQENTKTLEKYKVLMFAKSQEALSRETEEMQIRYEISLANAKKDVVSKVCCKPLDLIYILNLADPEIEFCQMNGNCD